ncbi:MAG: hypothetical protein IPJ62_04855 [Betaproteobacteria bacterium]|nr:hypothetical protein [Betaproteobacteria bacterium]
MPGVAAGTTGAGRAETGARSYAERAAGASARAAAPAGGVMASRGFALGWNVDAGVGAWTFSRVSGMRSGFSAGALPITGACAAPAGSAMTLGATGRRPAIVEPATAVIAPGTRLFA